MARPQLDVILVNLDGEPSSSLDVWQLAGADRLHETSLERLEDAVEATAARQSLVVLESSKGSCSEAVDRVLACAPGRAVVVVSGSPSTSEAVEVVRKGVLDYVEAPVTSQAVATVLARLREDADGGPGPNDRGGIDRELIGASAVMVELRRKIEAVAPHDATVLLEGETGTGKEQAARLIHRLSPRADRPFIVCNGSAIVPTLFESELFGHEKGAFTGARRSKPGLFEVARGGTLFLDQIQELPLSLQPKLLRVLENREFTRIGAPRPTPTDVRVIAAANRPLREEVRDKRFREDLYYRLHTALLVIPPLRDRKEDIPLLARHFLETTAVRSRRRSRMVSQEALQRLLEHPWEGNVRELKNAIERALVVSRRRSITCADLPPEIGAGGDETEPASEAETTELISLAELERRQIRRVLEMTGGNREQAARALGMSRSTLYRRLAELRMS